MVKSAVLYYVRLSYDLYSQAKTSKLQR